MAHFARVENSIVQQTIVVKNEVITDGNGDEQESLGVTFCQSLYGADTEWKQTSINSSFRKNFGRPGFTWDAARDAFIAPQPYDSWVLNETSCRWEAPVAIPDDGNSYRWDEPTTSWVQISDGE